MRKSNLLKIGIVLAAVALAVIVARGPASPDGRYVDKGVAADGDVYWEFKNGRVALVINTWRDDSFGIYGKTGNVWYWTNTHGKGPPSVSRLDASWWMLRASHGKSSLTWYRRFFAPAHQD